MKNIIIGSLATLLLYQADFWVERPPMFGAYLFVVTMICVQVIDCYVEYIKEQMR